MTHRPLHEELKRPQRTRVWPTWSLWSHPEAKEATRPRFMMLGGIGGGVGAALGSSLAGPEMSLLLAATVGALIAAVLGHTGMGLIEPRLRKHLRDDEAHTDS